MKTERIDKIVTALLYEGYVLYPYRRCVKNRQRWMFGCLYPRPGNSACEASDPSRMQTQCLLEGTGGTQLEVQVRFLHLLERLVARTAPASGRDSSLPAVNALELEFVESLEVDGALFETCQQAVERRIDSDILSLAELLERPRITRFSFPEREETELIGTAQKRPQAALVNRQKAVDGLIEWSAALVNEELFSVTVRIENTAPGGADNAAYGGQLQALVSTHTILHATEGRFVSSFDPPVGFREFAARQRNHGVWPVLVGDEEARDTVLASPIILHDYPQVAEESPGDLFDATEIDEILSLRVMTLTDDEKRRIRGADDRVRQMLQRTEALPDEQIRKLHGALRGLRTLPPLQH